MCVNLKYVRVSVFLFLCLSVCLSVSLHASHHMCNHEGFFLYLSAGKGASIQVSGADDMGQDLPQQIHRVLAAYGTSSGGLPSHS